MVYKSDKRGWLGDNDIDEKNWKKERKEIEQVDDTKTRDTGKFARGDDWET